MAGLTHYQVLGVGPSAGADEIREAYRRRARTQHPDVQAGERTRRGSAAAHEAGRADMSALNEAYRVLSDPGRRLDYDRQLSAASATSTGPSADRSAKLGGHTGSSQPMTPVYRPAQMPWRSLLISAAVAVVAVVALSQCEGTEPPGPDGILRVGDCAALEPNGDAVEVACTGQGDLVVRAFNPTFDGVCPGLSEPHRDRQGLGVACLERPD